ncbi:MAG: hypothetical protein NZ922_02170 [Candidatus Methanomethyliaceae archaeon]|nr:hypothetical protein [Candidatus Methanomethyliaceae archaeon]MCX8170137.1 hypothetical protein [Candidatus Methanomethyliaceae archaeon]MDW7971028.1 translin family protein [Nitrososphaerota archaeon]
MDDIIMEVEKILKEKDENREKLIINSREIIRRSGNAILAFHRRDLDKTLSLLNQAREILETSLNICERFPEYKHIGPLPQAMQEYAEAIITISLIKDGKMPSLNEVGVTVESYIAGLADSVGEIRRQILDSLREDRIEEAERLLNFMDEIYWLLKGLEYFKNLVPGLKRKVDLIRKMVEETRSDITLAYHGRLIRNSIREVERDENNERNIEKS